jgi:hypothetical protein
LKYLISIFFLVQLVAAIAQKPKVDTVKKDFMPSGVRFGTDLISLIRTQTDKSFSGYEVNADIDFYRYFLTMDVGKWERTLSSDMDEYANDGKYMRIGVDINMLKKDPEKNMFFFGLRYGWGTYSETFSASIIDPVYGLGTNTYSNTDIKAQWGELTTGLRVKMWKFFWMGYTARYKFALNTSETGEFTSYDVPGYGKTAKSATWGFNYQLLFRIPIRKNNTGKAKPVQPPPEKP